MRTGITVSNIICKAAPPHDRERGLLAYLTCTINDALRLDGICVRRTLDRRLTLSYPARRDRRGREHPTIAPVSDEARIEVERLILDALPRLEEDPR